MIIKIHKKAILFIILAAIIGITAFFIITKMLNSSNTTVAGGNLHAPIHPNDIPVTKTNNKEQNIYNRFRRPSNQNPFPNPYSIGDFEKQDVKPPLITKVFEKPEDLILAYYGILRDASNMLGYSGGCGSIGYGNIPYPYAYELFTKEKQNQMSFNKFVDSFKGIGYITLLKLIPAYAPPDTPENIKYYMVEFEVITGKEAHNDEEYHQGSLFGYYYGLMTVEKQPQYGWQIKQIDNIPEDFLCAPEHSWFYLSDAVVQIVYGDNLKIIETIDKTEEKDNMVYIYASGHGKKYRFDFVRITNGYDILLHENIFENGKWKETSLLTDDWKHLKLSVENPEFNK